MSVYFIALPLTVLVCDMRAYVVIRDTEYQAVTVGAGEADLYIETSNGDVAIK